MKSERASCSGEARVPAVGGTPVDRSDRELWCALTPLPTLDKIVPEHVAYVRSVVARFSVTPTHAREDLVQEVLIEAYRSRGSRLAVRALLFGITRHLVLRWMVRRRAERAALAQISAAQSFANRTGEDEWRERERREVVRLAIAELPDVLRSVFIRCEIQHMSMPEVARDLGIPANTGYTRLHLARTRFLDSLRRLLARRCVKGEELL